MNICVVGTGYVGLVTGAVFADLGNDVVCVDNAPDKVAELRAGRMPIYEPGLEEVVARNVADGRLAFTTDLAEAVRRSVIVFITVGTPPGSNGQTDLTAVHEVARGIAGAMDHYTVVVNKSTVPVGTAQRTADLLDRPDIAVVSNPEFLREGSGVHDFMHPDRIIIGSADQDAAERVAALYARLGAPTVLTDCASAELIKYAANCYLAMKLSYVNALAELCERLGADVADVTEGLGFDRRIGNSYLSPGPGWGGSCLPKDTAALLQLSDSVDFEFRLLRAAIETNTRQSGRILEKVRLAVTGRRTGPLTRTRIALLGLAFKAGTSDLRDSPALAVAARLRQAGAELTAYDPAFVTADGVQLAAGSELDGAPLTLVEDPYVAAKDADAVVVLTEWPEFRSLDWSRLRGVVRRPVVVDTRNIVDPDVLDRAGFSWTGVGRLPRVAS